VKKRKNVSACVVWNPIQTVDQKKNGCNALNVNHGRTRPALMENFHIMCVIIVCQNKGFSWFKFTFLFFINCLF
jgi:hypothetical protein